jgi:hypothetical protein
MFHVSDVDTSLSRFNAICWMLRFFSSFSFLRSNVKGPTSFSPSAPLTSRGKLRKSVKLPNNLKLLSNEGSEWYFYSCGRPSEFAKPRNIKQRKVRDDYTSFPSLFVCFRVYSSFQLPLSLHPIIYLNLYTVLGVGRDCRKCSSIIPSWSPVYMGFL